MRLSLVLFVLALLGNNAAFAAESAAAKAASAKATAVAAEHHEIGTKAFNEGKYQLAREEFEIAYKLSGEPDLLYNIALCYEREGALRSALENFTRYSEARPGSEEVRTKIERMRAELGVAPVTPPQPQSAPPQPARESAPAVQTVVPSIAPAPRAARMTKRRIAGVALIAIGGASLVATIALGAVTQRDRSALEAGDLTYAQALETADRALGTRGATIGLGVVGGISVAAGLPLLILPEK